MGEKVLMKGNEAIGEAAIRAGCTHFFGYPITPQNDIPAYMARKLPEVEGGCFLQAESEVAASNMVYGAAGSGARVMTSSSSPGISLKAEGISYIAGAELPCVIVNIVRGGPGLGGIQPAQSDYFQATKGLAHGDFKLLVLAPSSVQEAVDLTMEAFEIADRYRNPVMVMGDGIIGQMMEPVEFKDIGADDLPEKDWITDGAEGRESNVINSLYLDPEDLEDHNWKLDEKYEAMKENEVKYETENMEDAEIAIVAYGTTARIAKTAIKMAREEGIKVGLIRPITLFPFPEKVISEAADQVDKFLTVEMSTGQMVEDVRLAVNGKKPVEFYGRTGGVVPSAEEIVEELKEVRK
jgi:2-oxoglutarate ferredoxin oxidoreductase subunit alpha